jgi:hypothetical protein
VKASVDFPRIFSHPDFSAWLAFLQLKKKKKIVTNYGLLIPAAPLAQGNLAFGKVSPGQVSC